VNKEELTNLLMESYDRGVEDAKQEALVALEKVVAVMVAQEREACANLCLETEPFYGVMFAKAIRARGQE